MSDNSSLLDGISVDPTSGNLEPADSAQRPVGTESHDIAPSSSTAKIDLDSLAARRGFDSLGYSSEPTIYKRLHGGQIMYCWHPRAYTDAQLYKDTTTQTKVTKIGTQSFTKLRAKLEELQREPNLSNFLREHLNTLLSDFPSKKSLRLMAEGGD